MVGFCLKNQICYVETMICVLVAPQALIILLTYSLPREVPCWHRFNFASISHITTNFTVCNKS